MSQQEKENIINELLQIISDSEQVGGMPYSTAKELTALVRMLQVA